VLPRIAATFGAPVSEQPVPAREAFERSGDDRRGPDRRQALRRWLCAYRWFLAALGLLLVSTLIVVWARSRPGHDHYGGLPIEWQSILAWHLGTITGVLYFTPRDEREPVVKFYPHSYGWPVLPSGTRNAAQAARGRGLRLRT